MGSFKGYGRQDGPKRRRGDKNPKRRGYPSLEILEPRRLLSGGTNNSTTTPGPYWTPTSTNLFNAQDGPMANLGTEPVSIYQAYIQSGGNTSELPSQFPDVMFQNGMVGMNLKSLNGDFSQFESQVIEAGFQVTATDATDDIVEGYAPINALPTLAELSTTEAGQVQYTPVSYCAGCEYQGVAYNEAETSMFADVARTQYGVDGTGVTVGVLSTSVNQYQGGLSESYGTGDLNPATPVDVIQDGPTGSDDEGRAMLENIHDVAPGASLEFATGVDGEVSMGQNIEALAKAGSQIEVDDIGYFDDAMFQDGIIEQAVDTVVSGGVTYFSAAGNEGPDAGYLSQFRGITADVTGIGSGTFMNFNPNGGSNELLPVTTSVPNATFTFEYDQPYQFDEPGGATGVVTSNVNIYVINAATGAVVVGAAANQNNVAAQQPLQIITIPDAGSYEIAIQVVSGSNPGHVEFVSDSQQPAVNVSTEYGSAGGTSYPSSFGHNAGPATIGVGATPWWAPAPYLGQSPLQNEPFSSPGPGLQVFNVDGVPLASPQSVDNPTVTAPDGGNTSFFVPGELTNTTNPPNPGEVTTSTNLVPANQQDLPSFYGTSSAAPNAAAVAALMLEKVPELTPAEIRAGLEQGATAMNGQTLGTYDPLDGFGLVNAINSINAVDLLRVQSTNPAAGSTVTATPSYITVTFNKAVVFSSMSAADLTFTAAPSGVTVNVGAPIAVGNPTDPTIVEFPFSFTKPPGTIANGKYTFSIQSPAGALVVSQDGKDLVASGPISFTLADTTAPAITSTSEQGRSVTIVFSKALNPSTVTLQNIMVLRDGNNPNLPWPPSAADLSDYIDLNNDPRATISYNAANDSVTLNYSGLPQTELPSDKYAIVVLSSSTGATGVTDVVGNPLDGNFTGAFPTGANGLAEDFIQNLGQLNLVAPSITTLVMNPAPTNDTGIAGSQDTMVSEPSFIGQVYAPFPGTVANLSVYIEFSGLHNGVITLAVGGGGRGFTGTYDAVVTTDADGAFSVTPPAALPQGFQTVAAVAVGQPDSPPLPGLSGPVVGQPTYTDAFRIDTTAPQIIGASFTQGGAPLALPGSPQPNTTDVPGLTTLTLNVIDDSNPNPNISTTFATPISVLFPALNPTSAANISNYSLINTSDNNADESSYIATATFVEGTAIPNSSLTYIIAYTGYINLTFSGGLPAGTYEFVAHTTELQFPGLTSAAGDPLDDTNVPLEGTKDFVILFDVQPQPVYITSMALESSYSNNGSTVIGGQQSYFEVPPAGSANTRDNVPAPPTAIVLNFSNPLPYANSAGNAIDYSQDVQLIGSANTSGGSPDGDFGTLGQGGLGSTGTGFNILGNTIVTLYNYNTLTQTWSPATAAGESGTRLVLQLDSGTLAPDDYRIYIPNQLEPASAGNPGGLDTRIYDIYGNQLDGENLGNQTATPNVADFPDSPIFLPEYEDLQSDGSNRMDDMSGDGVAGGAFTSAFVVVPYGNVIYARADYVENPLVPATLSTGTLAQPYPVLAPEGDPSSSLADNPDNLPNMGLNNPAFFNPGALPSPNPYDFSGSSQQFEQSALYAAEELAYTGEPAVVVAEPSLPQRDPTTGQVVQASFVLESPAGGSVVSNGSVSVPSNTILVFQAGSTLKLENASLYVQNQGSALQAEGTATNPVTFTSYNDASVGGATNGNPDTTPHAGDWGGIVFRNYDQAAQTANGQPAAPQLNAGLGTLTGPNGGLAVSGNQDAMSILNYATIRYAGGAVPQATSNFFSAVTLFAARPTITNMNISDTGGSGGTEAAIGGDMDSFLEDDTARGPLIRQIALSQNSLNGIWLMSESNGFIEPTSAMPNLPINPTTLGGSENYTLFEPLPFIVLAQLIIGQELELNSGGVTNFVTDRLYVQPGVLLEFNKGSGIDLLNPGASLNVGSRSYINGYDQNNSYNPESTGFVDESASDPQVVFTSIFDDTATTTLVPTAINVTNETTVPTLGPAMWGSVGIQSGGIAVINAATFEYGGGAVNTPDFTEPSQSVLAFITEDTEFPLPFNALTDLGTRVYITNNNLIDNFDAAMQIEPNGLMAGNPLTPLQSGHPFFRGNVMEGNGIDGLKIITNPIYFFSNNYEEYLGPSDKIGTPYYYNQTVSTVWDATDLTYVVMGTIILAGSGDLVPEPNGTFTEIPFPTTSSTAYQAEPTPALSLTIQAALPGTLLADGETIPSPGQSVVVKLYNEFTPNDAGAANLATDFGSSGIGSTENAGAGFIVGVDDGVDPTPSPTVDPGAYSELRILGIPGNETTGQQRVPVIITSLRDDTVGTTVRGVVMDDIWNAAPVQEYQAAQAGTTLNLTTPAAGDGGYIYIGGNSMTEYDPTDPFDGSLIQDADISYMTRIEVQGGGIIDTGAANGNSELPDVWQYEENGYYSPANQVNAPMAFTISDSNLDDFADAAVFVHPTSADALVSTVTGDTASEPTRGSNVGEPVFLYMYNDTISNSGQGVHVTAPQGNNSTNESVYEATLLNDTFYNDGYSIQTLAPQFNGQNNWAGVTTLAMNDIFDGSSTIAVDIQGQAEFSQIQYDLFYNNTTNLIATTTDGDFAGIVSPTYANPDFVGPVGSTDDATAENFELEPDSPAINAARSEMGPLPQSNAIYPGTNQTFSNGEVIGIRTNFDTLPGEELPGGFDMFGYFGIYSDSRQLVTLPGSGYFSFDDEWEPVLTTNPAGYSGPASVPGTYNYEPITGQRDLLGYIRGPQAGEPGVGYGSNPFEDIGAYQYVNLNPPEVTAVTETATQGATPTNFYTVGGISGTNVTPWTINITFNGPLNPSSVNSSSVQLVDLGSNPAAPLDEPINLSGKLTYDVSTDTLVISLAAAGLSLGTDAYQITLFGSGSEVLTNLQGVALSGTNTVGGVSTGAQLALPSGNGYPGGNFFDSFIINTTPPAVLTGSLIMDPASESNIQGSNVTNSTDPTFDGTVSEPNPNLVPVAGQTAILDIGLAVMVNGVLTTYFDPSQLPSSLASLAQFIRPDAGTATSTTGGAFKVTVGVDGANTGLVTDTAPLPNLFGTYTVGADGLLLPLPHSVESGYYVARVVLIDQSGNQSNPNDPNARLPFIVDTTPPTFTFDSPTPGEVVTSLNSNGQITFTITADKNIDMTHFTANSISVITGGPTGVLGVPTDVTIPINPNSITMTPLMTGGAGEEMISFSTQATTLTNNIYEVTLLNTGTDAVRDIAGNVPASPVTETFAVDIPSLQQNLFVEEGFATSTTATEGTRENPYSTIGAAMTAATAGDVIAVLPGVYTEQVTMKNFVRLLSAASSSTDSTVFTTSTGDALSTIIRAPYEATAPSGTYTTVTASGIESLPGLPTEIAGFTIASPLVGDPALGSINPNAIALDITNSDLVIDKDYFIDAGVGIEVTTSGSSAITPSIYNDGIVGNINGVVIDDGGGTTSATAPVDIINNDFAFNTIGLTLNNLASTPEQAYVASNIFWQNHDQTNARNGYAIYSVLPDKVVLQNNLFQSNGASDTSQANATNNLGNGFSPTLLGPTAADAQADQGNFTGNPAFVFPIDPRPGSDGPANFFLDGDYQLTASSAAIDNAWEPTAIPTDLLGNSQVKIPGGGFGLPDYGPRDVGAFEFDGTGGDPVGGAFRIVTTSLVPVAGETYAGGTTYSMTTAPTAVTVTFSGDINQASISATDLVLSGSALNASDPAEATSLTWIDPYTVEFNLSGQFNPAGGTLNVALPTGSISGITGTTNLGYSDKVVLDIGAITPTPAPTPTPTPTGPTSPTPAPAPAPQGPHHKKKVAVSHPKKHVVVHAKKPVVNHVKAPVKHATTHKPEKKEPTVVHKATKHKK
jgi:large repetitive protein